MTEDLPSIPHGWDAVVAAYGDPSKYRQPDGTLSTKWERDHIMRVTLPRPMRYAGGGVVTKLAVHVRAADIVRMTMYEIAGNNDWWAELEPYGGGYEPRLKRGSSKVSLHTLGIALDFNPDKYPLGSSSRLPEALVAVFARYGWFYGGDFEHGRKDPMHFQYASGV